MKHTLLVEYNKFSRIAVVFALVFALTLVAIRQVAIAQDASPAKICNASLIPTIEQSSRDLRKIYSYMSANAESEYERLKIMTAQGRAAEASYKFFSAEYGDSNTKEEFREKVKSRISQVSMFSDDKEATTFYHSGLEDWQLKNWNDCVRTTTNAGALFLLARNEQSGGLTLVVNWIEPTGQAGDRFINLQAQNGQFIIGETKTSSTRVKFTSSAAISYLIVQEDAGQSIKVIANSDPAGFTHDVVSNPPGRTAPQMLCAENQPCEGYTAVLACVPTREARDPKHDDFRNIPQGTLILAPASPGYSPNATDGTTTSQIVYGPWANPQCGVQGNGWHMRYGSCGVGGGEKWQRCDMVKVEFGRNPRP